MADERVYQNKKDKFKDKVNDFKTGVKVDFTEMKRKIKLAIAKMKAKLREVVIKVQSFVTSKLVGNKPLFIMADAGAYNNVINSIGYAKNDIKTFKHEEGGLQKMKKLLGAVQSIVGVDTVLSLSKTLTVAKAAGAKAATKGRKVSTKISSNQARQDIKICKDCAMSCVQAAEGIERNIANFGKNEDASAALTVMVRYFNICCMVLLKIATANTNVDLFNKGASKIVDKMDARKEKNNDDKED